MKSILTLAGELAERKTTSQALVEDALMRIAIPAGEGERVFLRTHRESALVEAKASDALRAHGVVPSPLAGIPVSIKDLFSLMVVGQGGEDRHLLAVGLALESALRQ